MRVVDTALPGVRVVEPAVHPDARGFFLETWNAGRYAAAGIPDLFVQGNHARSVRGTLRGLHFNLERPQAKLVWVMHGSILDVAVDVRRGSPTFGRWVAACLSAENHRQIFVPAGFAHGYLVTTDSADVCYLCSALYHGPGERGVRFDDPAVGIDWPAGEKLLSPKDRALPLLADAPELPTYTPPPAADGGQGDPTP